GSGMSPPLGGTHHDHRYRREQRVSILQLKESETVHDWHHDVEENQSWPAPAGQQLERLRAVLRRAHDMPIGAECLRKRLAKVFVVLDDEDFTKHRAGAASCLPVRRGSAGTRSMAVVE